MFGMDLKDVMQLLLSLVALATAAAAWLRKPGEDAQSQVNELDGRLITLEERVKHMPSSDELTELEGTVKAIDERTKGFAQAIDTIRISQQRVENYLLNAKA